MSFTRGEFLRGAATALLSFVVLSTVVYAILLGAFVWVGLAIAWPSAIASSIAFSPGAYALGAALRCVGSRFVHLLVFGAYGVVVGFVGTGLALGLLGITRGLEIMMNPLCWINIALSAAALVVGRWRAMRLADRAGTAGVRRARVRRERHRRAPDGRDRGREDW